MNYPQDLLRVSLCQGSAGYLANSAKRTGAASSYIRDEASLVLEHIFLVRRELTDTTFSGMWFAEESQ